jgi:hypothetical protein
VGDRDRTFGNDYPWYASRVRVRVVLEVLFRGSENVDLCVFSFVGVVVGCVGAIEGCRESERVCGGRY